MADIEFIKLAYAKGKVQDASQAFIDYSPEEEWHQGRFRKNRRI